MITAIMKVNDKRQVKAWSRAYISFTEEYLEASEHRLGGVPVVDMDNTLTVTASGAEYRVQLRFNC